ncbi:MAG: RimK family alpha-L-glutamate ligase [Archaeoglobales archaeon]|nr:RimK family alpha-L-glutamate ligase [Archaeoglobales archaeon]
MKIACFVESYNFTQKQEVQALQIFSETAKKMGHSFELRGKEILEDMNRFDSVFIRATTDPLFTAYTVSRLAEEMEKRVIDDSGSIRICSNKIAVYYKLKKANIPMPETRIVYSLDELEYTAEELGYPLVVKSPNSRFSLYVEKANNFSELSTIVRRFMRRSKAVLLQEFMPTPFDWRIGVLEGEAIYSCKYLIPKGGWRIRDYVGNKKVWGDVIAIKLDNIPRKLRKLAEDSAKCIGDGLYGIDIKEFNGKYYVIEVNDNPTIMHGCEDTKNPELYEKIIKALSN